MKEIECCKRDNDLRKKDWALQKGQCFAKLQGLVRQTRSKGAADLFTKATKYFVRVVQSPGFLALKAYKDEWGIYSFWRAQGLCWALWMLDILAEHIDEPSIKDAEVWNLFKEFNSFHIWCIEAQVLISQMKRTGFTEGRGRGGRVLQSRLFWRIISWCSLASQLTSQPASQLDIKRVDFSGNHLEAFELWS